MTRLAAWLLRLDLAAVAFVLAAFCLLLKREVQRVRRRLTDLAGK